jgi:hypothetical protein
VPGSKFKLFVAQQPALGEPLCVGSSQRLFQEFQ